MDRLTVWTAFLLVSVCYLASAEDPTYSVLISRQLRPSQDFEVCVSIFDSVKADVKVKAKLQSVSDDSVLVSKMDNVSPGSTKTLTLKIPDSGLQNEYTFVVEGSGGTTFSNESAVTTTFKSLIILIQTDKPIYQAGQPVLIRILALGADLKPYTGLFEVAIFDPSENKLMQFKETDIKERDCNFVLSIDFQLADETPLGTWTIKVKTENGEIETRTFAVEEYVLPSFGVELESSESFFHDSMSELEVVISVMYTYGQPVRGKVDIEVYLSYYKPNSKYYSKITKMEDLTDGKYTLKLNHTDLLGLYYNPGCRSCRRSLSSYPYYYQTIVIKANATDAVTDEVYSGEVQVPMKSRLLDLEYLSITPSTFKADLMWTGFVKLTRADGGPLQDDDRVNSNCKKLKATATFSYSGWELDTPFPDSSLRTVKVDLAVPEDGIIMIEHKMKVGYSSVSLYVRYPGGDRQKTRSGASQVYAYKRIEKLKSRDDEGIQLSLDQTGAIMPSDTPVKFTVTTSKPISMYWFKIMSKGNVVAQGQRNATWKSNSFEILFDEDLAQRASPSSRVLVWCLTSTGEIIVDSVELVVDGTFANSVELSFDKDVVEPGEEVTISVKTEPKSCVALRAVDKSIELLKGAENLEKTVENELSEFDSTSSPVRYPIWFDKKRKRRSIWWYPRYNSGKDTAEILENSGVILMTDAYVHEEIQHYFQYPMYNERYAMADNDYMEADLADDTDDIEIEETKPPEEEDSSVRELFPETWLWEVFNVSGNRSNHSGQITLKENAPDTITTFITTAFAINKKQGIGFTPKPVELTVFKNCFADIRLPFSAVRSEELELRVVVFNYHKSEQTITVTLKKSMNDEFYARGDNEISPTKAQELVKEIKVPANDGKEVTFDIKPVEIGDIPIEVHIRSTLCRDALRKNLKVEAEGEPCDYSDADLFSVENEKKTRNVKISYPDNVVSDSQRIQVTAIGDIMGPSISNLDKLIKQPYGCGEQNMLNFAPNIYALDYMEATGTGTDKQKADAIKNMKAGYQREMTFVHSDGSFSAFGKSDKSGSSWLTAFVLRCFNQAKNYITIDKNVLAKGANFLIKNQNQDGSFAEPGRVLHSAMQGKAARGIPFTAYIAKVLTELKAELDPTLQKRVQTALVKVQAYLEGQLDSIKDNAYTLGLTCYFLCEVDSKKADKCMEYFEDLAVKPGGSMYWDNNKGTSPEETDGWFPPYRREASNNIETSSYGLLTYCLKGDDAKAALVAKWLSTKRSSLGGYGSTQDTVIGLQALAEFAAKTSFMGSDSVDVKITWDSQSHDFDTITRSNADVLQQYEIPNPGDVSKVKIIVNGTGTVLVQVNVFFNKEESSSPSGYDLVVKTTDIDGQVKIIACVKYNLAASGMSVMEFEMLTAHEPDISGLVSKYGAIGMRKAEYKDNRVALYFDQFTDEEVCVELTAKPISPVKNLQAALAEVYSYYSSDQRATVLYAPVKSVTDPETKPVVDGSGVVRLSVDIFLTVVLGLATCFRWQ